MNTLDTVEEQRQLNYYYLCISNKDWNRGDLKDAMDFIRKLYESGNIKDMLEIGCGMGDIVSQLPTNLRYTGIDPVEYPISQAKKNYPNQIFVISFAENMPFDDSSFDFIFSFQTIQMIKNPRRVLNEIVRVLKPNGYILLIAPNMECPWSSSNSLKHQSRWELFTLTIKRFFDLFSRFFGKSAFRVIPETYAEATGDYDGKDNDLKYLLSTWEIVYYLKSHRFKDIGTKKSKYALMRDIDVLQYYGGGIFLLMQKTT